MIGNNLPGSLSVSLREYDSVNKQARRVNQRLAYHRVERWTITEIRRQLIKPFHF